MTAAGSGLRPLLIADLAAGVETTSVTAADRHGTTVKHARRLLTELAEEGLAESYRVKGRGCSELLYRLAADAKVPA